MIYRTETVVLELGVSNFITSPDLGHPPVWKGMLREASYLSINNPVTRHGSEGVFVSMRPNREANYLEDWHNTADHYR